MEPFEMAMTFLLTSIHHDIRGLYFRRLLSDERIFYYYWPKSNTETGELWNISVLLYLIFCTPCQQGEKIQLWLPSHTKLSFCVSHSKTQSDTQIYKCTNVISVQNVQISKCIKIQIYKYIAGPSGDCADRRLSALYIQNTRKLSADWKCRKLWDWKNKQKTYSICFFSSLKWSSLENGNFFYSLNQKKWDKGQKKSW